MCAVSPRGESEQSNIVVFTPDELDDSKSSQSQPRGDDSHDPDQSGGGGGGGGTDSSGGGHDDDQPPTGGAGTGSTPPSTQHEPPPPPTSVTKSRTPHDPHTDFVKERQHSGDSGYWTSPSTTMKERISVQPPSGVLAEPLHEVSESSPASSLERRQRRTTVVERLEARLRSSQPTVGNEEERTNLSNSPRIHEGLKRLEMGMPHGGKLPKQKRKVSPDKLTKPMRPVKVDGDIRPGRAACRLNFDSEPAKPDDIDGRKVARKSALKVTDTLRKLKDSSSEGSSSSPSISPKTTQPGDEVEHRRSSVPSSPRRRNSSTSSRDSVTPPGTELFEGRLRKDMPAATALVVLRKASSERELATTDDRKRSKHRRSVELDKRADVTQHDPKPPDTASPRRSPLVRRNSFKKAKSMDRLNEKTDDGRMAVMVAMDRRQDAEHKPPVANDDERGRCVVVRGSGRRSSSAGAVLTRPDKAQLAKPPSGRQQREDADAAQRQRHRRRTKSETVSENDSDSSSKKTQHGTHKSSSTGKHRRSNSDINILPARSPQLSTPTQAPNSPRVRRTSSFSKAPANVSLM